MPAGTHKSPVVVYGAMAANCVIAVAKFAAAGITGSSSLLAEGFHSVVDTGNQALILLGLRRSRRPPDEMHPFGYGQELYFWSLIVATLLFGIGGGLSAYEGVLHVLHPSEDTGSGPLWNYVVLAVALVAEGSSFVIAFRAVRQEQEPGETFFQALRGSKDPSTFIVVGEDAAALAGLVVAFLGVWLSHRLGMPWIDGAASVVIGLILCGVAIFLASESRHLLLGESVDPGIVRAIARIAQEDPAVLRARPPLTMHLGRDEVLLNLDVEFQSDLDAEALSAAIRRLERKIREEDSRIQHIFIEANVSDGAPERPLSPRTSGPL